MPRSSLLAAVIAAVFFAALVLASSTPRDDPFWAHRRFAKWYTQVPEHVRREAGAAFDAGAGPRKPVPVEDIPGLLQQFIAGTFECYGVPGLTVSVVANNEVLYAGAFGVRDLESQLPVTTTTLFGIGSTSKAFTAAAVGLAVDAGAMAWTDLVRTHVPGFEMYDAVANASVTMKDLMSHRTGLPRHDDIWATGIVESIEAGAANVKYLEFNLEFRDEFQYNNWCWSTAGVAVENALQRKWADIITQELLEPIQMFNTTTDPYAAYQSGNYATGSVKQLNGSYQSLPADNCAITLSTVAPAGVISSNALDMAEWIKFQINNGSVGGHSVVTPASMLQARVPVMALPGLSIDFYLPANGVSYDTTSYAFGWMPGQYRGYRWFWHNGGTLGHATLLTVLPDAEVGVFISINGIQGPEQLLEMLITYYAIDLMTGMTPWLTVASACAIKDAAERDRVTEAEAAIRAQQSKSFQPFAPHPSEAACTTVSPSAVAAGVNPYAGTYTSPFAGTIVVNSDMSGTLNAMSFQLNPMGGSAPANAFWLLPTGWGATINPTNASSPLQFSTPCPDGSIPGLQVLLEPSVRTPYYFGAASAASAAATK